MTAAEQRPTIVTSLGQSQPVFKCLSVRLLLSMVVLVSSISTAITLLYLKLS